MIYQWNYKELMESFEMSDGLKRMGQYSWGYLRTFEIAIFFV